MNQLMYPQSIRVDGVDVEAVHVFGKKSLEHPPLLPKASFQMQERIRKILGLMPTQKGFSEYIDVVKYKTEDPQVALLSRLGYGVRDIFRKTGVRPYQFHFSHGFKWMSLNGLLNEGIDQMWDLVDGTDTTNKYTNALARVGVGNSATAFAATQTALQGASTAFAAMDATYPTSTTQKINAKGTFGSGTAEFAWEEYTIDNGSSPNKNLNRALSSKGTKGAGETWTLEVQITLS